MKLAVLVSGNGTNLQAIIDAAKTKQLHAEICLVISNVPTAYALERARRAQIPTAVITERVREKFDQKLLEQLQKVGVEWIALAGFMKILSSTLVRRYWGRIVNIHPALLPAFPGKDAIAQAWRAGVKETGCTIHFVDEGVDTGPIIGQERVPVRQDDTLESLTERMHAVEHELYPKILQQLATGKIRFEDKHP